MTPRIVRLPLDYQLKPDAAEVQIDAFRNNALNVQFGIFRNVAPFDLSGLVSVTMHIRPARTTASNLASITLAAAALKQLPSRQRWDAGVMQHGTFEFTNAQMNLTVGAPYRDYWWVVYAINSDSEEITLGDGVFRLWESNIDNADVAPTNPGATITLAEAVALFLAKNPNGINAPTNPLNKGGVKTLSAGDTSGTVTFGGTAFASAPTRIQLTMQMPDANGAILSANWHTPLTTGFSFELSGEVPASGTYKLIWEAIA